MHLTVVRSSVWLPLLLLAAGYPAGAATPSGTLMPAPGSPFAAGTGLRALAIADFNRDGKPDIAVASSDPANSTITLLLGNGAGGFPVSGSYPAGGGARSVTAADFNGDGVPDLAVANFNTNNVTMLLSDGAGGFRQADGSPISGPFNSPVQVVAADFNRDGKLDIAVANQFGNDPPGSVAVLLGDGAGHFSLAEGSPFAPGPGPSSLAVADFDGDGNLDLAVTNSHAATPQTDPIDGTTVWGPGDTVTVMMGDGTGRFHPAQGSPWTVGQQPETVVAGDLNGDGKIDLAVTTRNAKQLFVLLGDGAGGFSMGPRSPYTLASTPDSLLITDADGDGVPDLAIASGTDISNTILFGKGDGSFAALAGGISLNTMKSAALAAADLNGDGRTDFAGAYTDGVTVLLGAPAPTRVNLSPTYFVYGTDGSASIPLTARLAFSQPYSQPTGFVTFRDGSETLGTAPITLGRADFQVTNPPKHTHWFTATYSGDDRNASSVSSAVLVADGTGGSTTIPQINTGGVTNGASFLVQSAAPNTVLSVFGTALGCDGGTKVSVDGSAAEVLAATSTQINFVTPGKSVSGEIWIDVACGDVRSKPYRVQSAATSPALFALSMMGSGQGAIVNASGLINGPQAPAVRGEYVSLYGTGFGAYSEPRNGLKWIVEPVSVFIGGRQAVVLYAGEAPGYTPGLQQINVLVPADAPTGSAVPVRASTASGSTQDAITLAIR